MKRLINLDDKNVVGPNYEPVNSMTAVGYSYMGSLLTAVVKAIQPNITTNKLVDINLIIRIDEEKVIDQFCNELKLFATSYKAAGVIIPFSVGEDVLKVIGLLLQANYQLETYSFDEDDELVIVDIQLNDSSIH